MLRRQYFQTDTNPMQSLSKSQLATAEIDKLILKFIWKFKEPTQQNQNNPEKEQNWKMHFPILKLTVKLQ